MAREFDFAFTVADAATKAATGGVFAAITAAAGLLGDYVAVNHPEGARSLQLKLKLAPLHRDEDRALAWLVYVHLVTRISIVPLGPHEGMDREAISSVYKLFSACRDGLLRAGPSVSKPPDPKQPQLSSMGALVTLWMNTVLRPFLSFWHPELLEHEATRKDRVGPRSHEAAWPRHDEFRESLATHQQVLREFARQLEAVLGVQGTASLIPQDRAAEVVA